MSEEKSLELTKIRAKIVSGHGIASGKTEDHRFPTGTISMQMPFFESQGFSGKPFHPGTLNLDVSPYSFILGSPSYQFFQVKWCEYLPPENFSFFSCRLMDPLDDHRKEYLSYVYWPHPSTKPGFEQPPCVLEILAPYIPAVHYGQSILIKSVPEIIRFA